MNAKQVRRWVNVLVANGLRKGEKYVKTGDIGPKATQRDVAKVRKAMLEMAQRLHPLEGNDAAQGPAAPGAGKGPHDLPEVREAGEQPAGQADAAAGEHKP